LAFAKVEMRIATRLVLFVLLLASTTLGLAESPGTRRNTVRFESEIVPLLARKCLGCHNQSDVEGGLNLATRAGALAGGESGAAIVAGKPSESLLIGRVATGEMPPKKKGESQALTPAEVALLRAWIEAGARWPEERVISSYEVTTDSRAGLNWWSLRPIENPSVPGLEDERVVNPVDAFILKRLDEHGMTMAPPVDKRSLVRRVYFDLIGLPPTPEEVAAFVESSDPDAYVDLVDRLLAMPQYGERWARYWLDLVRFAETNGYERDATKPKVWKYRDYVIGSFNDDKPYDQFVMEQLAGDELENPTEDTVTATGFLRLATWDDEPNDRAEYRYDRLEDLVHTTSSSFLGLTVKCARCHDHKFDPIPQTDYYSMASVFWAGYIEGGKLMGGPDTEQLGFDVFGWTDRGREVEPFHLLRKGDPNRPGQVVEPRGLTAVASTESALSTEFEPPPADANTTHRRLQLALWITDRRNPLTARVLVNRLWQHHFGQALVRSPNNFGFKGQRPTHPKLLDWLASEFMAGGWKLKRMHKLLVLSGVYRQSSEHPQNEAFSERDDLNQWWWRAERRRLEAEALRDSMLRVSGDLNLAIGGPSFFPRVGHEALVGLSRKGATWGISPQAERHRRSIYIFTKRSLILPLMTTFDFCDTTTSCAERDVTTVAPQALALLNNQFVHERSEAFAHRLVKDVGGDRDRQIERAWLLAFGRVPSSLERAAAREHLRDQEKHFESKIERQGQESTAGELPVRNELKLWLRADAGVEVDDDGGVTAWRSQSGDVQAAQDDAAARPKWIDGAINGRPTLRFNGRRSFLKVSGRLLTSQRFAIFAVVSDADGGGHRGVLSNWSRNPENMNTSVFLGLARHNTVRLTDDFATAGEVSDARRHFLLTGIAGERDAVVYQNDRLLAQKGAPLAKRNLATGFVIGRQGTLNGEFWNGDIAEVLVYDRQLNDSERERVWRHLRHRYALEEEAGDPAHWALSSLCHVLLNANEFIYVD